MKQPVIWIAFLLLVLARAGTIADMLNAILTDIDDSMAPVDPDDVGAISFPADHIQLFLRTEKGHVFQQKPTEVDRSAEVHEVDLHVLCGWWDRPDSLSGNDKTKFEGTCDYMFADYTDERNMTCYASNPRLIIETTHIVCAMNYSAPASFGPAAVVQNSCKLTIHGRMMPENACAKWNPRHGARLTGGAERHRAVQYDRATAHYWQSFRQIAETRRSRGTFPSQCRFNRTAARIAIADTTQRIRQTVLDLPETAVGVYRQWMHVHSRLMPSPSEVWADLTSPLPEEGTGQCGMALRIVLFVVGVMGYALLAIAVCLLPWLLCQLWSGLRAFFVYANSPKNRDGFHAALGISALLLCGAIMIAVDNYITIHTDRIR